MRMTVTLALLQLRHLELSTASQCTYSQANSISRQTLITADGGSDTGTLAVLLRVLPFYLVPLTLLTPLSATSSLLTPLLSFIP